MYIQCCTRPETELEIRARVNSLWKLGVSFILKEHNCVLHISGLSNGTQLCLIFFNCLFIYFHFVCLFIYLFIYFHFFYSTLCYLFTAVPCTYFDAPKYGIRACNKKTVDSNGVLYEMICTIQCKAGYAFADPTAPNTYFCRADGVWNKLLYGVQFVPVASGQRPWPDCARKY